MYIHNLFQGIFDLFNNLLFMHIYYLNHRYFVTLIEAIYPNISISIDSHVRISADAFKLIRSKIG